MAIVGLSLEATRPYHSKLDKGAVEEKTTFRLGTLDSRIMGRCRDMATSVTVDPSMPDDEVETSINNNEVSFQMVSYGLKGWENFKDAKGNDIKFQTLTRRHSGAVYEVVDPECLKLLPHAIISELAGEIAKDNELSSKEGNG